jgi:hypothetical protein
MTQQPPFQMRIETLGALHGGMSFARPLYDHLFGSDGGAVVMRTSRAFLTHGITAQDWTAALSHLPLQHVGVNISAQQFLTDWLYLHERKTAPAWPTVAFFYAGRHYHGAAKDEAALALQLGLPDLTQRLTRYGDVARLRALMAAVDASEHRLIAAPLDDLDHWICDTILNIPFTDDSTARLFAGMTNVLKYETTLAILASIADPAMRRHIEADIADAHRNAA